MTLQAFAVFDEKAGVFAHPFFALAVGQALRTFQDWCRDPNTPLSRHPADYKLYRIGRFEDTSGEFSPEAPNFLAVGGDDNSTPDLKVSRA